MKKKLVATLSIMITICLSACSGSASLNNTATLDEVAEETEEVMEDNEEDVSVNDPETFDVNADPPKQNGIFGYIDNNLYYNEYFGFEFIAFPGYMFLPTASVQNYTEASADLYDNDMINERLESGASVIDFSLVNTTMTHSVTLTLGTHDNEAPEMSREEYEAVIDALIPQTRQNYENMGAKDIVCERSSVTFLREDTPCIKLTMNYAGTDINMLIIIMVKERYSAIFTFQADTDERISALVSCCIPIE